MLGCNPRRPYRFSQEKTTTKSLSAIDCSTISMYYSCEKAYYPHSFFNIYDILEKVYACLSEFNTVRRKHDGFPSFFQKILCAAFAWILRINNKLLVFFFVKCRPPFCTVTGVSFHSLGYFDVSCLLICLFLPLPYFDSFH